MGSNAHIYLRELKYAEINAATYINFCLSDKEIEKLKENGMKIVGSKKYRGINGFCSIPQ